MTEREVRDVVSSMTGTLDEVRREQNWRAIEATIAKPERQARPLRWLWLAVPAFAVAVIAIVWPRSSVPDAMPPTTLTAREGERAVFARDGLTLTLIGPGAATVRPGPIALRIEVTTGTMLGERTSDDAPPVELAAAGNSTTTRDARFAIRVVEGTVVLGTGERALAMIERETHQLVPPVAPVAPVPVAPDPVAPPPPDPDPVPVPPRTKPAVTAIEPTPAEPATELPPIVAIPLSASELYQRAEASLRVRDPMAAKRLLARLIAEHPSDPLVSAARYDLALMAISEGDAAMARSYLQLVIEHTQNSALRLAAKKLAASLDKR